ncbi:MAG: biotin/lipoyl-binding protein, partial [Microcoleus sp. SM1_3_4]|nr:biotin/lipoyl-binding protein [Microcoleus sp. SM1_3_4]
MPDNIQLPNSSQEASASFLKEKDSETATPAKLSIWKRLPHRLPYWLAGLGVLGLLIFALRPTPLAVDLETVQQGTLLDTVDAEGKTRVRDRFIIAAPLSGRLARIKLESGDSIEKGTVVAQIDSLPFNTEVQAQKARLQELQAQMAGVETQRTKPAALAQAEAQINAAIANQRQAQANYQEAQANLAQAIRDRDRARELTAAGAQSRKVREDAELLATRRQQEVKVAPASRCDSHARS